MIEYNTRAVIMCAFLFFSFQLLTIAQNEIEINPDGLVFPRLTTVERDDLTASAGQFIYNTTSNTLNYFNGSSWVNLAFAGLSDLDGDTKIDPESIIDEDIIRMTANGREVVRVMAESDGRERLELENTLFNTYVGEGAGESTTTGDYNSFYGYNTGVFNTTGVNNAFFGSFTGFQNSIGESNSFFGANAGSNNSEGSGNCFFGESAGIGNTIGEFNSFYGLGCGEQNTLGESNSFYGVFAGQQNTIGNYNAMFGVLAGQLIEEGNFNSFFGENTASFKLRGHENSYFGHHSGANDVSGSFNTLIGSGADFSDGIDSLDRAIAIGYNAYVACNNCAVIGGTGEDSVRVGIGTSTPSSKLEVNGGDVKVIGGGFYDDAVMLSVPDYVFAEDYELKSLEEVSNYIKENQHLEGFPSMYDINGWSNVSLQNRDMKLLEKVEELFLHAIRQNDMLIEHQNVIKLLVEQNQKVSHDLSELRRSTLQSFGEKRKN